MMVTTFHGRVVQTQPGDWVVNEYYKGLLNEVYVFKSYEAARRKKEDLVRSESFMMNSPKHFAIREVKQ